MMIRPETPDRKFKDKNKLYIRSSVEGRGRGCIPPPETMLRSNYTVLVLSSDDNAKLYTDDTIDYLYDFFFSHDLMVLASGEMLLPERDFFGLILAIIHDSTIRTLP